MSAPRRYDLGTVEGVGLAVVDDHPGSGTDAHGAARDVRLLATVDADEPSAPSLAVTLRARW